MGLPARPYSQVVGDLRDVMTIKIQTEVTLSLAQVEELRRVAQLLKYIEGDVTNIREIAAMAGMIDAGWIEEIHEKLREEVAALHHIFIGRDHE